MILEDYLRSIGATPRVQQHFATVGQDFQRGGLGIPKGIFDALVGTGLGLPLEATAATGKYATGTMLAGVGQATQGTPLQNPVTDAAYRAYGDKALQDILGNALGPISLGLGAGNAVAGAMGIQTKGLPSILPSATKFEQGRSANEAAAGQNKYVTGILNTALDPSNIAFGEVGAVMKAKKAARLGAVADNGALLSNDFVDAATAAWTKGKDTQIAADMARNNGGILAQHAKNVFPGEGNLSDVLDQNWPQRGKDAARLARELGTAQQATADAKLALQAQQGAYRAAHDNQLFKQVTPAVDSNLPAWLQVLKPAGDVVVNPNAPLKEQTFQQFTGAHHQMYLRLQSEEQQIADQLKSILPPDVLAVRGSKVPDAVSNLPVQYGLDGKPFQVIDGKQVPYLSVPSKPEINSMFPDGGITPDAALSTTQVVKLGGTPVAAVGTREAVLEAAQMLTPTRALDGSIPLQEPGYLTTMSDFMKWALKDAWGVQRAAMGDATSGPVTLGRVASVWKGMLTETVRNTLMDPIFNHFVAANEGIRGRTLLNNEKWIMNRLATGESNPLLLFGESGDWLTKVGAISGKEAPSIAQQVAFVERAGANIFDLEVEAAKNLTALEFMLYQTGLGLANPLRGSVSLLTAPLGYLAPMRRRLFHIINNVTHMASRSTAFDQAFLPFMENSANTLLLAAEAEGKNTAALRGLGAISRDGTQLSKEGMFSAEEVLQHLGQRYADEWTKMVEQGTEAGFTRSKEVFGDYTHRSGLEKSLNTFMPLMSWSYRAFPRVARMTFEHPAVANALLHFYTASMQEVQRDKLPGYQAGTIGIDSETPLVGLLARLFSPQEEASIRANPIGLFLSVNPDAALGALGGDSSGTTTPYQNLKGVAGIVGGQFNPIVQGLAYVTGQDYSAPGPLSRYAAVDQEVGTLTGNTFDAPSIAQGPLRAARKAVTGKQDTYDPVEAVAQRLVMERTGVPVADTRNKQYAIEIARKTGIYQEAQKLLDTGDTGGNPLRGGLAGGQRAIFNAVTPVSVSSDPKLTQQSRKDKAGMPFSYEEIQAAQQFDPKLAQLMQQTNLQYQLQHPASAVAMHPTLTSQDTQDPRLTAWENKPDNVVLKKYLPAQYAEQLAAFKKASGIR